MKAVLKALLVLLVIAAIGSAAVLYWLGSRGQIGRAHV